MPFCCSKRNDLGPEHREETSQLNMKKGNRKCRVKVLSAWPQEYCTYLENFPCVVEASGRTGFFGLRVMRIHGGNLHQRHIFDNEVLSFGSNEGIVIPYNRSHRKLKSIKATFTAETVTF